MTAPTVSTCRGCGAPIDWVQLNGRWHPAERSLKSIIVDGKLVSGPESHFAHCSQASKFRNQRGSVTAWLLIASTSLAMAVGTGNIVLSRVDALRSRVRELENRAPAPVAPDPRVGELAGEMLACHARTEHLRAVLEVLIPSGIWPERVRLPNPPPGWAAWPMPGPDRTLETR